jgi:hypothetical protein
MGAEYDIKGRNCVICEEKTVGEKEIKLNYWSVPILYKFTTAGKTRFSFQFGPQFSFLSDGSEINKMSQNAFLKVNLESTDLYFADAPKPGADWGFTEGDFVMATKDDFNKTDIGAVLGLGLEADITTNLYLSGNLRFYYGFKDVRSDAKVDQAEARGYYDSRNNVSGGVQLGLHYRFDLK